MNRAHPVRTVIKLLLVFEVILKNEYLFKILRNACINNREVDARRTFEMSSNTFVLLQRLEQTLPAQIVYGRLGLKNNITLFFTVVSLVSDASLSDLVGAMHASYRLSALNEIVLVSVGVRTKFIGGAKNGWSL